MQTELEEVSDNVCTGNLGPVIDGDVATGHGRAGLSTQIAEVPAQMSSLGELERRIQRLEDLEAIRRLKADYLAAIDAKDLDTAVAMFTDDGTWEGHPFGTFRGRSAIRELMDSPEMAWSLHFVMAPAVSVADDGLTATARWYLIQTATITESDGSNPNAVLLLATYDDKCVKRDGRWYFTQMVANIHHICALDKGWVREPMRGVEPEAESHGDSEGSEA